MSLYVSRLWQIFLCINPGQTCLVYSYLAPLSFLSHCSQRYETLLKDYQKKSEQQREVLTSLQQDLQKAQGLPPGKRSYCDCFDVTNKHLFSHFPVCFIGNV
uniref:Uncharacterized protein n=1 Tax=Xiphophorus couchianus TaxID=32473 RepID=A0A3B5LWP5_9TELE